ncbi:MAG TPA: HD domain-containing protein [Candidatus Avidesulfovibrio excrementigallinarum]|nr:HD domain-containing protein [Candidatus Avidesulfovibrio excrementigallinarum]
MAENWMERLPELGWLEDRTLRACCEAAFAKACREGGWTPEDLDNIPMTLGFAYAPSLRTHIRAVACLAHQTYATLVAIHGNNPRLLPDYPTLMAGALLHDVGKLLEYTRTPEGTYAFSQKGLLLRHPFSGAILAAQCGLPDTVTHIIAVHAREGSANPRTVEAQIVNKVDLLHFESVRQMLADAADNA